MLMFLLADNTKKDSDSTPVKGGTDMGEEDVFVSANTRKNSRRRLGLINSYLF